MLLPNLQPPGWLPAPQRCPAALPGLDLSVDRFEKGLGSGRTLTSRLQRLETERPAEKENVAGLAGLNRALIGRAEAMNSGSRMILDLDSTEIPEYGEQEQSACNGQFGSRGYHLLLLFNREGNCLAAKLRPGNVHSTENWHWALLPEIDRHHKLGKEVVFRADAAFAKPEIYEALEERVRGMPSASCPTRT